MKDRQAPLVDQYYVILVRNCCKDLARVAGQIASMTLGLGPIARLFT